MKSFKFKNFNFIKLDPISITIGRVKLVDKSNNGSTIKINFNLLTPENTRVIKDLESKLRHHIGKGKYLKSCLYNDRIWASNYLVKKINQTNFINCDPYLSNMEEDKYYSITILVDNMYFFSNNVNTVFYKIKLKEVELIN